MKSRWIAFTILILSLAAAASLPVAGKRLTPPATVIHGRMAESGGWAPDNLTARVGQPLHLRLTSDDVMHGFAVGQSEQPAVDVIPGETTDVTLSFDKPGKYTYYCTRWCGLNHWRMRGTIDVTGPEAENSAPDPKPLYMELGIDLDAPHPADVLPGQKPSAARGAALNAPIPDEYLAEEAYLVRSPEETWQALRAEPGLASYTDGQVWDMVAWIASQNTTAEALAEGKQLYAENCAACHGESGAGDGVMAGALAGEAASMNMPDEGAQITGHESVMPADFTNPATALGASPALLQGKIIRGGMGTGMPYWGPILTDEQIQALVAYIQSFQLELER